MNKYRLCGYFLIHMILMLISLEKRPENKTFVLLLQKYIMKKIFVGWL